MDRNNLIKKIIVYATIFLVIIFLIGMVFFRKDDNDVEKNNPEINKQQLVEDIKKEEITEEEKVRMFAENFATTYYSYTWGNFSNIESQYYYMTDEMKEREESKAERIKEEIKNQSQKYFTARAELIDSNFIIYEETKATLEINLNVNNYAGAIVQRDTMIWVNENGDYYEGDLNDLIVDTRDKKIEIKLLKIGDEWKVDEVEEFGE